jgi:N2-acetyl-L-2,4-diaminobutanoate deacetylase
MKPNPIAPTVDFEADGRQHGFLRLPWSRNESAWGNLMIPISVIKNGAGPTALFSGANHGDEYEGPVALLDLARLLDPSEIKGRVIILPFMNYPAFLAGRRLSPVDGGNMNRLFPGRPDGSLTEKIADYIHRTLLPMADLVLDIHSGGRTLEFLPFAAAHVLTDKAQEARCFAARDAFGAPYSVSMLEIDAVGMYDTAAEALGKVFVTTELGGGGSASARTVAIAKRGVRNLLKHLGVFAGRIEKARSTCLEMTDQDCFSFSEGAGLVEFCADLGDKVRKGEMLLRVHPTERTGLAPAEYRARRDGLLAGRHFPGLCTAGDCLAVVASEVA